MKKLFVIIIIASAMASCQKENVTANNSNTTEDRVATPPKTVADAFTANFGNLKVSEWKLRNDGTWRAHFTKDGKAWEATFSAAGDLLKSEPA